MAGRLTIGLFNSYDTVRFAEAHRRAIARAAPVALAFDANLATFGFPYSRDLSTPIEIASWLSGTTSIGEQGKYLQDLAAAGRFMSFPFPDRGFPPQLGEVVITTSRPDPKRAVTSQMLADRLRTGMSLLLVFGLGPKGLEHQKVHSLARYDFDLTGRGISLETATAIGAAPAVIAAHLRR